jgi:hypothetical protein
MSQGETGDGHKVSMPVPPLSQLLSELSRRVEELGQLGPELIQRMEELRQQVDELGQKVGDLGLLINDDIQDRRMRALLELYERTKTNAIEQTNTGEQTNTSTMVEPEPHRQAKPGRVAQPGPSVPPASARPTGQPPEAWSEPASPPRKNDAALKSPHRENYPHFLVGKYRYWYRKNVYPWLDAFWYATKVTIALVFFLGILLLAIWVALELGARLSASAF